MKEVRVSAWYGLPPTRIKYFNHRNIIDYCNRPFATIEQHDEELIQNWNSMVKNGDTVYHLGDFAFAKTGRIKEIFYRLNGHIILIEGNHDAKMPPEVRNLFSEVHKLHEIKVEGQRIVLCHFPMLTWHKSHKGSWMLNGHSHGNLPDDPNARRIDVGVDCHNYYPISFERVQDLMSRKKFVAVDHHEE